MKIRSKLADLDFELGRIEYKQYHLIVQGNPGRPTAVKAYLSPEDVLRALALVLSSPRVLVYVLCLPFFLFVYRRRRRAKIQSRS